MDSVKVRCKKGLKPSVLSFDEIPLEEKYTRQVELVTHTWHGFRVCALASHTLIE